MVKLQQVKGRFFITVPKGKVTRKKWTGGEEFDCEFDSDGTLRYIELKE